MVEKSYEWENRIAGSAHMVSLFGLKEKENPSK
jgi:hypothetical protein